jgi:hypothetical protein
MIVKTLSLDPWGFGSLTCIHFIQQVFTEGMGWRVLGLSGEEGDEEGKNDRQGDEERSQRYKITGISRLSDSLRA